MLVFIMLFLTVICMIMAIIGLIISYYYMNEVQMGKFTKYDLEKFDNYLTRAVIITTYGLGAITIIYFILKFKGV